MANEHNPPAGEAMTMRDYFAAKAMQSLLVNHRQMRYWSEMYSVNEAYQFTAEASYILADAMLKERSK